MLSVHMPHRVDVRTRNEAFWNKLDEVVKCSKRGETVIGEDM